MRSYFLNEVDGIKRNDGILMLGSTNHLDRLDPGIAKRPSRFDRKYLFPNPGGAQRTAYARYWRRKLEGNKEGLEFPERMCGAIAGITGGFSFAYIQEAMVASLLAIAARGERDGVDVEERRGSADRVAGDLGRLSVEDRRAALRCACGVCSEGEEPDLSGLVLWREIQKQVKILREEMGDGEDDDAAAAGRA